MVDEQVSFEQPTKPAKRALRRLRSFVSTRPFIYLPLRKLRKAKTVVGPDTQLLIEGAPRCGNTWTEALIRYSHEGDICLAHHSHAVAHVKAAVKRGIPSLILYREPDAAIRSFLALKKIPEVVSVNDAFIEYVLFYKHIMRLSREHIVFASFEDVTQRPDLVIEKLNHRFSLRLRSFNATSADERQAVFDLMDRNTPPQGEAGDNYSHSNPNHYDEKRAQIVAAAKKAILEPQFAKQRAAAHKVYGQLKSDIQ